MKQVIAISLAILTLVMNLGLTVNNHFCGDVLAKTSLTLGVGNVGCGMEKVSCEKPNAWKIF